MASPSTTVAALLVRRLCEVARQVSDDHSPPPLSFFGVPGDYSCGLCDAVEAHADAAWRGCACELNAGYAADGYARVRGLAVLATTYGVGELSAINAVAGAYAERVPIVCLTSSPRKRVREAGLIVHHSLAHGADYQVFMRMHKDITAAQTELSAENAASEIERCIEACIRTSSPVYINLPEDVALEQVTGPGAGKLATMGTSDEESLAQAVRLISDWANVAARPVILADMGVMRARAHDELRALVEATDLPCATMGLGRTALPEFHANHIGVYEGERSWPHTVKEVIENSDCIISVGCLLTDYNTGGFSARLSERVLIDIKLAVTTVKKAIFVDVRSVDVVRALSGVLRKRSGAENAYWRRHRRTRNDGILVAPPSPPDAPLTCDLFLASLQAMLRPGDILCFETMTLTFGALPMRLPSGVTFITQFLYGSIGMAGPAAGGAARAVAHDPSRRVILVTGDGSLQMTATHLATMLHDGLSPIVFVVNNDGYLIEKLLCKRKTAGYNEIPRWRYTLLPAAFGGDEARVHTATVDTAAQLQPSMRAAEEAQAAGRLAWVELRTPALDVPEGCRWMHPGVFLEEKQA